MSEIRRHITARALVRLLGDWRDGSGPMYRLLARRLGQLISDGRVAPGVRLPAERRLADELGLSRTTIVRTYGALREEGLLESRRGAGSVTRLSSGSIEQFVAWSGVTRLRSHASPLIDLTKAAPGAGEGVLSALEDAAGQARVLLHDDGYHPLGLAELRAAVAARYEYRGAATTPEQILITGGAQQAIDLLARALVRRETVVVESPTYPGAMDSLRLAGARMVSLDVSTAPWDLEALEALVTQTGARFAYVMPDFQNPTGRLMPDGQREELVRLCRRHGVTLIVDEALAEVALEATDPRPRPVAADDASEAVLSIGSMSKAVWGGLRVGWIRSSPRQIAALAAARTTADLSGAPLEQIAAADLLTRLDEHLDDQRSNLIRQRDAVAGAVAQAGWQLGIVPRGGLSAWVRLPTGSSSLLADAAFRHGVVVIPGPRLSPDGALDRYLRIPYSLPAETLALAVVRLREAWEDAEPAEELGAVLQVV